MSLASAWTAKANKRVQFGYGLNYMIDIENAVIAGLTLRDVQAISGWRADPAEAAIEENTLPPSGVELVATAVIP